MATVQLVIGSKRAANIASATPAQPIPSSTHAAGREISTEATICETASTVEWVYADQQYFDVWAKKQVFPVSNQAHAHTQSPTLDQAQLEQKKQQVEALIKLRAAGQQQKPLRTTTTDSPFGLPLFRRQRR
jgi:hypothetical protein